MKIGYLMQEGGPDIRQQPFTGPANHVWQVCKQLRGLGHDVTILACYQHKLMKSLNLNDFQPVDEKKLQPSPLRLVERLVRGIQSRLHLPYLNLFNSLRFSQACQQVLGDCDLYYERMGWMGFGGGLAARKLGKPLILEANNGDYITELKLLGVVPRGLQLRIALWLMRKSILRASHIIASGEGHRDRFIDFWSVTPEAVSVVENGSELVDLLSRDQLKPFNPQVSTGSTRLVFIGAFEPWHGISILLPAMARAISQGVILELDLIGAGSELANIRRQIAEFGLTAYVNLTGQLSIHELIPYLVRADIGVSPYCGWMEFSGLKLFDYKAAGLAIVASGLDGRPSTLRHGETALIVEPCDEEALCQALIELAADIELRRRLGATARQEAENQHSWRHTALELEAIFSRVIYPAPEMVVSQ